MRQFTALALSGAVILMAICWCKALPQNSQPQLLLAGDNGLTNIPNNMINFFQTMFNNIVKGLPNLMTMFTNAAGNLPGIGSNSAPSSTAALGNVGSLPSTPSFSKTSNRGIDEIKPDYYSPKTKDVEVFSTDIETFNE